MFKVVAGVGDALQPYEFVRDVFRGHGFKVGPANVIYHCPPGMPPVKVISGRNTAVTSENLHQHWRCLPGLDPEVHAILKRVSGFVLCSCSFFADYLSPPS